VLICANIQRFNVGWILRKHRTTVTYARTDYEITTKHEKLVTTVMYVVIQRPNNVMAILLHDTGLSHFFSLLQLRR